MKIVFTDSYTMNPGDLDWIIFKKLGNLDIYEHTSSEELVERIKNADIIVSNKTILSEESLSKCEKLKLVCVSATGFNNIDINYLNKRGIPACNAVNYSSSSVAQHVVSMILHVYNSVAYYNTSVKQGRWQNSRDFCYYDQPIEEIRDKKVGIIGFGSIGRTVGELFNNFGAQVQILEYKNLKDVSKSFNVLSKDKFLETSDIVSLHLPLRVSNEGMVDRSFLKEMKSDAILVNTSRGPLINEKDLYDSLTNHEIRAACLDVRIEEPPKNDDLKNLHNCIITPHQAWASKQSRQRLMQIVADNISAFQKGNILNKITQ